jgi:Helix-turn-helix domain
VDEITIGARLRTLRRWRGKTQAEVAGLAGLSPSFVSMVENGQRPLDRRSHIAGLASALNVSETDLMGGPHLTPDPVQSDPHKGIPALRVALATNTLSTPAVDRARPLADLADVMTTTVEPARRAADYTKVGGILPSVLDELHYHVAQPADEAAHQLALHVLVDACVDASVIAKNLNYNDLAHSAAERAWQVASVLDDPVDLGKASYAWLLTLPRAGSLDRNLAAAERAASLLEPYAHDPLGLQVLGMITLTSALAAACSQKGDSAAGWLDEAQAIGARMPDEPMTNWHFFSTTNVNIWRVAVGVERGESGGAVLELADRVDVDRLELKASRLAGFFTDVGCGLAREPKTRAEAVRWLRRAEETAPQRTRNSAVARETVAYLLSRATAASGGRELRGMAARMGLPH